MYNTLVSLGFTCENVAEVIEYRKKGDIKISLAAGDIFVDVKHDSRIEETKNILCEEENYICDCDYYIAGDMKKDYDYIAIVNADYSKIYFIDFKILKEIYKLGDFREIRGYD